MQFKSNVLAFQLIVILIFLFDLFNCDYIRSKEISIKDSIDVNAELINLNDLIYSEKSTERDKNYIFKLVEDSLLVDYFDLKYLDSENTIVFVKKPIDFNEICQLTDNQLSDISTKFFTCSHSLKIIAINENHFIEVPIQLQKLNKNYFEKVQIKLEFTQNELRLDLNSSRQSFAIQPAHSTSDNNGDSVQYSDIFNKNIVYYIEPNASIFKHFDLKLDQPSENANLMLNISSKSKQTFRNALNKLFTVKLLGFIPSNSEANKYGVVLANATLNLNVKVEKIKQKRLDPLNFEQSVYSTVIEMHSNNFTTLILQPTLKSTNKKALKNNEIVFTLFQEDTDLPFYVNEKTGSIHLKENYEIESTDDLSSTEKSFSFGIKATYKQLDNMDEDLYVNDYLLPAFAKVQITLKDKPKLKIPIVQSKIVSPFVSKYEILNEESNNKTFILYVNEPSLLYSELIQFQVVDDEHVELDNQTKSMSKAKNKSRFDFVFSNHESFINELKRNTLTIINKVTLKDQNIYRSTIKVMEKLNKKASKNGTSARTLVELRLEVRVDFDPILFEQNEYRLDLNEQDLLNQNVLKIAVKQRANRNILYSIAYRILNDDEYFDINSMNGWLSMKKPLFNMTHYELNVNALNKELQKSANVKVKVFLQCDKFRTQNSDESLMKGNVVFNLFENSPNRTQIGLVKSVCTDSSYFYELSQQAFLEICSLEANCTMFDVSLSKNRLFTISNGYLMTNNTINKNILFDSLQNQEVIKYFLNDENIYDLYKLTLHLKVSIINRDLITDYAVEIRMRSTPELNNFNEYLLVEQVENETSSQSVLECLYNYKFSTNNQNVTRTLTQFERFVRIDNQTSAHLEAEFLNPECSASFQIHNNGCLSFKPNHYSFECSTKPDLLLKASIYSFSFKLCFYDNNKVSCSKFYNQSVYVKNDLYRNSQITVKIVDQMVNSTRSSLITLLKKVDMNIYMLGLLSAILLIALIAILTLMLIFTKPKFNKKFGNNGKMKKSNKLHALQVKNDIADSSDCRSSPNTPETTSNAATFSSKLSRTDDENEDNGKILVSDDYNRLNPKMYSAVNNFSYAGSYSSMSSCHSKNINENIMCITENNQMRDRVDHESENEHGIYSVKSGSIQFQKPNDDDSCQISSMQTYQIQNKLNSLKNIKKELTYRKCISSLYSSPNFSSPDSSTSSTSSTASTSNSKPHSDNKLIYEASSYKVMPNREVLLTPDHIIASVV